MPFGKSALYIYLSSRSGYVAIEWKTEKDDLLVFRVSGKLSISEMGQAQSETDPILSAANNWKVMVVLSVFEGWSKEPGWENTSLIDETDKNVERMALVGPIEWRDQVEMFTLKGMRPLEIEYFTSEDEARAWLGV
jgi:hypothetical protein